MGKILGLILRSQWDRATALAAALASVAVLIAGWVGVASTSYPAEQVPYVVSGGIFGIFLMAMAATLWVSADLRDEWRKLDEVGRKMDRIEAALANGSDPQRSDPRGAKTPVSSANGAPRRRRRTAEAPSAEHDL